MSKELHDRVSDIWNGYIQKSFHQAAEKLVKDSLGIKVPPEAHTRIRNYSGEAVLTIPEEDRVCTWEQVVDPSSKIGLVYVSYRTDCCTDMLGGLYNGKVEAILKQATYCMFCGKKVKWKD